MLSWGLALALQFVPAAGGVPNRQPHLAILGSKVALVYGAGDRILVRSSSDAGATFGEPVALPVTGKIALGMRRGPRVAITRHGYMVTAITGETLRGEDGDVTAWFSEDGKAWSAGRRLNSAERAGREGLHAMGASEDGTVAVAWLDLRGKGTQLWAAISTDGGRSWHDDRRVYESPSGSVCECCHPAIAVSGKNVHLMFRNVVAGSRDMYLISSANGGKSWGEARKMGLGTWRLEGCPMDGGDLQLDAERRPVAVWRRDNQLFLSTPSSPEEAVAVGKNAVLAVSRGRRAVAWMDGKRVRFLSDSDRVERSGAWPSLVALPSGRVLLAWEDAGTIHVESFGL
ncbi:MAG: sialidase family protein [Bryobacteraceae bacterium]|nr:sialidase family protein [Bryobacteraceae bacterium]